MVLPRGPEDRRPGQPRVPRLAFPRPQPDRPFFAFLNYYDAHHPYQLPETGIHRFSLPGDDEGEVDPIEYTVLGGRRAGADDPQVARDRDAYDDCIANLDEEVGRLIDALRRRSVLDRTWIVVVADHGESFGEHPGVFRHGTSLYGSELHVPLVIVPPESSGIAVPRVVDEPVSLRDLAATVVDATGQREGRALPRRIAPRQPPRWRAPTRLVRPRPAARGGRPPERPEPRPAQLLEPRVRLAAVTEGDWKLIRRTDDAHEELYQTGEDPREQRDLAADPASRPVLDRLRRTLDRLTAGPLTQDRFNP